VVQPYLALGQLTALLDAPALASHLDQRREQGASGRNDDVVRQLCRIAQAAAHQQPTLEAALLGREAQPG
jgi:hypothetical protein